MLPVLNYGYAAVILPYKGKEFDYAKPIMPATLAEFDVICDRHEFGKFEPHEDAQHHLDIFCYKADGEKEMLNRV